MVSVASIKDNLVNNKKSLVVGAITGLGLLVGSVKFVKWAKKEIEE